MEPISSFSSARATASQPPVPAQQRRDSEAISAPQTRSDSFATSAPGQDVQLQRRQVVEDISQNQKITEQLRTGNEQLGQARDLARQASDPALDEGSRRQLNEQFEQVRNSLNELADQVERGGRSDRNSDRNTDRINDRNTSSAARLRVDASIDTAEKAEQTAQALDSSQNQINQDIASLTRQGQALGADFPRTTQRSNVEPAVQSSQDASRLAAQLQRTMKQEPQGTVASQANISRQTTLTLFQ